MHGGLFSRDDVTLNDIREINRNRQPPEEGLMCDLLWSDPQPQPGKAPSKRGVGVQFGPDITQNFLTLNNLDYIIRSHEVKNEGYEVGHNGKCITVFSAPNYWYVNVLYYYFEFCYSIDLSCLYIHAVSYSFYILYLAILWVTGVPLSHFMAMIWYLVSHRMKKWYVSNQFVVSIIFNCIT